MVIDLGRKEKIITVTWVAFATHVVYTHRYMVQGGDDTWHQLVKAAAHDPKKREDLRTAIVPFVRDAIHSFLKDHQLSEHLVDTLMETGMMPFDSAYNAYVRNWTDNYPHNDFRAYYRWWMRQAVVDRLIADGHWRDGDETREDPK